MSIEITGAFMDLQPLLKGIEAGELALKRATSSAVNKTAVSVRTEAIRMIRKDYNVKTGDVRELLKISNATPDNPEAVIRGSGSPGVPLYDFGVLPKRVPSTVRSVGGDYSPQRGVSVMVHPGGRITIPHTFAVQMASGHVGIFERVPGKKMKGGKKEAIRELFGPSPIRILASDRYAVPLDDFAADTLDKNMQHEAEFFLKQAGVL